MTATDPTSTAQLRVGAETPNPAVAGAPILCGECYADHCWRCSLDCDCLHLDNEGVFL